MWLVIRLKRPLDWGRANFLIPSTTQTFTESSGDFKSLIYMVGPVGLEPTTKGL